MKNKKGKGVVSMSNTLAVLNNVKGAVEIEMSSLQVVDLINKFRKEEGNKKLKEHRRFLQDIRKEVEVVKSQEEGLHGLVQSSYKNAQNKEQPCYIMNRFWIMLMLNKESTLVRYKTQQYIEALENRLKQQQTEQQTQMINKQYEDRLDRLEGMVATMVKSFNEVVEKLGTTAKVVEQPKSEQISFINTPLRTPYTATKIGKQINRKPEIINKVAASHGIITKTNNGWVLNKKYEEAGYGKTCNDGQWKGTFVRYSEKGAQEIKNIFNK